MADATLGCQAARNLGIVQMEISGAEPQEHVRELLLASGELAVVRAAVPG
jgi:hypothetical protein